MSYAYQGTIWQFLIKSRLPQHSKLDANHIFNSLWVTVNNSCIVQFSFIHALVAIISLTKVSKHRQLRERKIPTGFLCSILETLLMDSAYSGAQMEQRYVRVLTEIHSREE